MTRCAVYRVVGSLLASKFENCMMLSKKTRSISDYHVCVGPCASIIEKACINMALSQMSIPFV